MTRRHALLLAVTAMLVAPVVAAEPAPAPLATAPHLRGLSSEDAATLIAKVADAQIRLRNNEPMTFELLSGAPASYPMTRVSPRDAFLRLPLGKTFSIERKPTDNKLWQPHRITILPDGPGTLLWDVEVVLGFYGNIERIEMVYRPPAPF